MNEDMQWWAYGLNALVAALTLAVLGFFAARNVQRVPGRLQNFFEWALDGLRTLYGSILGDQVNRHLPFLLALFFYILFCNLIEFIPGFHAPTSNLSITLGLALMVFVYVQYTGIRVKGILGYLRHFLGPLLALAPLFIIIEVVGELAKPISLSMRLYGNIFGEDVINDLVTRSLALPTKVIPIQFVVYLLQLFTAILQAFIFTLLTSAYISIMSAHHGDDHDEHGASDHGKAVEEKTYETTALAGKATH